MMFLAAFLGSLVAIAVYLEARTFVGMWMMRRRFRGLNTGPLTAPDFVADGNLAKMFDAEASLHLACLDLDGTTGATTEVVEAAILEKARALRATIPEQNAKIMREFPIPPRFNPGADATTS